MDDLLPNALDFVSPLLIKLRRWLVLARSPLWIAPLRQLPRPFSEGEPGGALYKCPCRSSSTRCSISRISASACRRR